MSEMVERVAKALCLSTGLDYDDCPDKSPPGVNVEDKDWYRGLARAAIETMKEPTGPMLRIGEALCDFTMPEGFDNSPEGRQRELKCGYQAMVDEALK